MMCGAHYRHAGDRELNILGGKQTANTNVYPYIFIHVSQLHIFLICIFYI